MTFSEAMTRAAGDFGLSLTSGQIDQFTRYYELLVSWNEKMNLTAITEPEDVAVKHMIDSLSAYDERLFTQGASIIDVGTGAGFPGIPLKILSPDLKLTLMDSLGKRVKFLETVVTELGLEGVDCVHSRAEDGARNPAYRGKFDLAVSRAVARLSVLAEYCLPFVRTGGHFLALKGMKYEEESEDAARALKLLGGRLIETRAVHLPGLDDKRAILVIRKVRETPKAYPRKAGTPVKKPL